MCLLLTILVDLCHNLHVQARIAASVLHKENDYPTKLFQ